MLPTLSKQVPMSAPICVKSLLAARSPVQLVCGTLITCWVIEQVTLVVTLGINPCSSPDDFGNDLGPMGVEVFLLHLLCHPLGNIFLSRRVVEDGGAIL